LGSAYQTMPEAFRVFPIGGVPDVRAMREP
jgi:hypothetical protein